MVLVSSTLCWTVWELEEEDFEIFMLAFQFAIWETEKATMKTSVRKLERCKLQNMADFFFLNDRT